MALAGAILGRLRRVGAGRSADAYPDPVRPETGRSSDADRRRRPALRR